MSKTSAWPTAGEIKPGSLRLHGLVALLTLASCLCARAQSDASSNDAGATSVQQAVHNAGTGARWDHDVANASNANASVASVKVSVDASKLRNIVGYRAFGIQAPVSDSNLVKPQVVELLNAAAMTGRKSISSTTTCCKGTSNRLSNWASHQPR